MNVLSVISFLLATGVLLLAIFTATNNPMSFLDYHGMLVVLGGSVAATAVSFRLDRVLMMFKVFWMRTIKGRHIRYDEVILELMQFAEAFRNNDPGLKEKIDKAQDQFLRECLQLMTDEFVDEEQTMRLLRKRADTMYERYYADAQRFKAIGKYPPAMGLLGAVTGMIALLGSLGKPGAEKTIGPAMSVALVATLYGIALANFFVIPIGENLADAAKELKRKNIIIIEGVKLIKRGTNSMLLAEELNSFLLPGERIDAKKAKAG